MLNTHWSLQKYHQIDIANDRLLDDLERRLLSPKHAKEYVGEEYNPVEASGQSVPFRVITTASGESIPIHWSEYLPTTNALVRPAFPLLRFEDIQYVPNGRQDMVLDISHASFDDHLKTLGVIRYGFGRIEKVFGQRLEIWSKATVLDRAVELLIPAISTRYAFNPESEALSDRDQYSLALGRWYTLTHASHDNEFAALVYRDNMNGIPQGAAFLQYDAEGNVYVPEFIWKRSDENKRASLGACLIAAALGWCYANSKKTLNIGVAYSDYKKFWKGRVVDVPGFAFKQETTHAPDA